MTMLRCLIISCCVFLTACAATPSVTSAVANPQKVMAPVVLGPGDVIEVKFRFWPELDYQQSIRPDGKISLQMVDDVMAAGFTPEDLDKQLTRLYATKLKSPEITVIVVSLANQNIYVGGEVMTPGIIPLVGHLTPIQAVMNSGGFRETAAPESAIIIRKGRDNRPVPIPMDLQEELGGRDSGSAPAFQLQPADVVYVPKSSIAKANKFVREYIQDLILFRGVGIGFNYDLNDNNNN